jgi:FixJ family two-component response regulator
MDGIKLGTQLLQIKPRLPIILSTGYSGLMTEESVREMGFQALLVKPTTARALGEAVNRALHPE